MFKCPKKGCEKEYEKIVSLSIHFRKGHKSTAKQLYVDYYLKGIEPACKCGCKEEVKFLDITRGFSEYRRGHISRIKNNWGHNKKANEKSHETRKRKLASGEIQVWNKGLKKEDHPSIAKYAKTFSETLTQEERDRRSNLLKSLWKNNKIPIQKGENHSQWNGGTSSINWRCHGSRKLYYEWKFVLLKKANFICNRCTSTKQLEVHHDKEKMSNIIHKFVAEINPEKKDDWNLQTQVVDSVVAYHIENKVSGEVLCRDCHKLEHPSYNYKK